MNSMKQTFASRASRRLPGRMRAVAASVVAAALLMTSGAALAAPVPPDGSIAGLEAKFVDVKGVKTRYYEYGQGEPLVLIHGGATAGANVWSKNIQGLAKRFHVFAVDRLGSGMTQAPKDGDWSNTAQVEHVYQFIQLMKLGKIHLVGHSSGGALTFYLAIEHPEIIKELIVVAHGPGMPALGAGPGKVQPKLDQCPDQSTYEGRKCRMVALAWSPTTFDDEFWAADQFMVDLPTSGTRTRVAARSDAAQTQAYRQRMWDRVKNDGVLKMPIMIYGGKQDVLDWEGKDPTAKLNGEMGFFDIVGAKNPNVKMVIVNEGGHFMYREHPEQFNHDVISFIDYWKPTSAVR